MVGALAILALGCDRLDLTVTLGPGITSVGLGGENARLLPGRWLRVSSASGALGNGSLVETLWEFSASGRATRTVTTRTALGQTIDVDQVSARWRADGALLRIEFGAPSFRVLRMAYSIEERVDGTFLYLDGLPFLRIGL